MIEIKELKIAYAKEALLESISLKIAKNLCILGANGSGKSSLAKALCGLIPSEGEILIDGEKSTSLSLKERAKLLSYIPTKLEVYDTNIEVSAFVLLGRFAYKRDFFDYSHEDKKRAQKQLEFLHISHLSSKRLSELSSGQKQLVLIAQALTQESKVIIFDEPTANLDPKNSKLIATYIKKLTQEKQVLLITHDIALAHYMQAPVAFLKEKTLLYFEQDFFNKEQLQRLYGVTFDSMAVAYE